MKEEIKAAAREAAQAICARIPHSFGFNWREFQPIIEQHFSGYVPKAEADALRLQVEMDTECIERIRNHGMKLEVENKELRSELREAGFDEFGMEVKT